MTSARRPASRMHPSHERDRRGPGGRRDHQRRSSKLNQEMQDRIAEYRLQRIENDEQRELASINHRYDMEKRKAQRRTKSLSAAEQEKHLANIELARKEAIATADARPPNGRRKRTGASEKWPRPPVGRWKPRSLASRSSRRSRRISPTSRRKAVGRVLENPRAGTEARSTAARAPAAAGSSRREEAGIDKQLVNELYDAKVAMAEQQARQERRVEIARGRQELRQAALAPSVRAGSLEAYQTLARHNDPACRSSRTSFGTWPTSSTTPIERPKRLRTGASRRSISMD